MERNKSGRNGIFCFQGDSSYERRCEEDTGLEEAAHDGMVQQDKARQIKACCTQGDAVWVVSWGKDVLVRMSRTRVQQEN